MRLLVNETRNFQVGVGGRGRTTENTKDTERESAGGAGCDGGVRSGADVKELDELPRIGRWLADAVRAGRRATWPSDGNYTDVQYGCQERRVTGGEVLLRRGAKGEALSRVWVMQAFWFRCIKLRRGANQEIVDC